MMTTQSPNMASAYNLSRYNPPTNLSVGCNPLKTFQTPNTGLAQKIAGSNQTANMQAACNLLKKLQTPNMALGQKVIRTNLSSLHNSLRVAQILSVTNGYPQMKKDSVEAVFIQLYADYPNSIGSVQRLPDDIGLVPVILMVRVYTKPMISAQSLVGDVWCIHMNIPSAGGRDLNLVNIIYSVQPLGSIPRDCSSLRRTRLIHVAKVASPSFFISFSNCSRNSGVSRIWYWGDLFSFSVDMVITLHYYELHGNDHVTITSTYKAMPRGASTLTGHLTTNDNIRIEVAMNKHITPVTGRNSLTPNIVFTWRFAECQENKATYHHVTAHTEDEARSLLPGLLLVFTARIRQGVNHG